MNTYKITLILVCATCAIGFIAIWFAWRRDRAGWSQQLEAAWRSSNERLEDKIRAEDQLQRERHGQSVINELNDERDELQAALAQRDAEYARKLEELRSARNVAWIKPARRMPDNEVKRAFAIDATAPVWVALNQELDDYLQDLMDEVSLPPSGELTTERRTHLAGGIEMLRLFHKRLLDLHAKAQKVDEDLEGEGKDDGADAGAKKGAK